MRTRIQNFVTNSGERRRGAFLILAFFCLAACLVFVAFTVDIGYLSLTKTRMQNAVDAAALAAAQEITASIANAPANIENVTLYAEQQARQVAAQVAELNGVYIDPASDVRFGQRKSSGSGEFGIVWDVSPYNVVKVTARRDSEETGDPDGKLQLFFAGITGDKYARVQTDAIAYVEARDLVIVHDFSRSMNFDSFFQYESGAQLSHSQTLANLQIAYNDLAPPVPGLVFEPAYYAPTESADGATATVTFRYDKADVSANCEIKQVQLKFGTRQQTFNGQGTSGTFQGTGSNNGRDITEVHVTLQPEATPGPVTLTGAKPTSGCEPQIFVTYSADRKSISVSADKDLSNVVLEFENGVHFKFDGLSGKTGTFSGSGQSSGLKITTAWIKSGCNQSNDGPGYGERFNSPSSADVTPPQVTLAYYDTNANVMKHFGWDQVAYPYPSGSWNAVINHSRTHAAHRDAGYREMYGGLTLMNYIFQSESGHTRTPDLWKVKHYPFHAIKEGHELLCNLLDGLGFDDHIGMVSYDTNHRVEMILDEADPLIPFVDISHQPITSNYAAVNNLMKYKQAGHYSYATNMGGGLKSATQLLENYRRPGARPTILLMTDGNTNTMDAGESTNLPADWDWDKLFDYDKDGVRDYFTNVGQKRYVLRLAKEAVDKGYTIHTMSVGVDADGPLMEAIAHLGKGHWINVPGGMSVADMEQEVDAAFQKIASFVPPAKLLNESQQE